MRPTVRIVLALCALAPTAPAAAAIFNATYELQSGDFISFQFSGTVQSDGDIVIVDSLLATPAFNSVAPGLGPISGFLSYTDATSINVVVPGDPSVTPALLSFSGAVKDFIFYNDYDDDGFSLSDIFSGAFAPTYNSGPSYTPANSGAVYVETFEPSRWSLVTPVPLPAGFALLAVPLAMLSFPGRSKVNRLSTKLLNHLY